MEECLLLTLALMQLRQRKTMFFENGNAIYQRRKLNNGQEYQIYKIYYQPKVLLDKLTQLGFQTSVKQTNNYFVYAEGMKL